MIETPTYIENHKLVLDAFGYWPSFHDGEIHSLTMDRTRISVVPIEELPKEEGKPPCFKVFIEPAFGLSGEFQARAGRILSVTPCPAAD